MSKLLGLRELQPVATQLPVSWYFDPAIYQRELEVFFKRGPGYVGHELMVPSLNDYRVLEMTNGAWSLVHNLSGIDLISNVCRHRQAVMLKGAGNLPSGNIVCPLHRWTYDGAGQLLGAPHFAEQPCLNLPKKKLQNWHGSFANLSLFTDDSINETPGRGTVFEEVIKHAHFCGVLFFKCKRN